MSRSFLPSLTHSSLRHFASVNDSTLLNGNTTNRMQYHQNNYLMQVYGSNLLVMALPVLAMFLFASLYARHRMNTGMVNGRRNICGAVLPRNDRNISNENSESATTEVVGTSSGQATKLKLKTKVPFFAMGKHAKVRYHQQQQDRNMQSISSQTLRANTLGEDPLEEDDLELFDAFPDSYDSDEDEEIDLQQCQPQHQRHHTASRYQISSSSLLSSSISTSVSNATDRSHSTESSIDRTRVVSHRVNVDESLVKKMMRSLTFQAWLTNEGTLGSATPQCFLYKDQVVVSSSMATTTSTCSTATTTSTGIGNSDTTSTERLKNTALVSSGAPSSSADVTSSSSLGSVLRAMWISKPTSCSEVNTSQDDVLQSQIGEESGKESYEVKRKPSHLEFAKVSTKLSAVVALKRELLHPSYDEYHDPDTAKFRRHIHSRPSPHQQMAVHPSELLYFASDSEDEDITCAKISAVKRGQQHNHDDLVTIYDHSLGSPSVGTGNKSLLYPHQQSKRKQFLYSLQL